MNEKLQSLQPTDSQSGQSYIKIMKLVFPFLLFIHIPRAAIITVYMPSQGTSREKYFNHNTFKGENAVSGGK